MTEAAGVGGQLTRAIDIGGSNLKAVVQDRMGPMVGVGPERVVTPKVAKPAPVVAGLVAIAKYIWEKFDRVSVGFPGVVRERAWC